MPVLVKVTGEPAGQLIELKDDEVVIGRLPECAIVLDPHGVSRKHARIRREGDEYLIADLNSRNKTKVNERELPPDPYAHALRQGDRINICDVEFIFYRKLPSPKHDWDEDGLVVTEGIDDSTLHTLDASRSDQLACAIRPETKLRAIIDITQKLCSNLQIDTAAPAILDSLLDLFPQAERGFLVLLKDGDPKRAIRKTFHKVRPLKRAGLNKGLLGRPAPDEARLSISRSIINHVLVQKKAVLSQDAGNDQNLPTSASIADLKIRSVMCAPLLTPDAQALGILQLDTSDRKQFGQEDLDILATVASQAAIHIQNAAMHESLLVQEGVRRDLALAKQVQTSFLPKAVPQAPGYEFFAYYNAAYLVGGDYYDFVPLPGNRLAIALGDVSGKGIAAALMMAKFSGDTRYCILTEDAPARAADGLNDLLCAAGIEEKFITLSLGVLDFVGGELTLCSAGHLPVMIRRAGGGLEEVGGDIAGFPLGILPDQSYRQMALKLGPGDVVVVYSDGVTDARNPQEELYDSKENRRLHRRLAESAGGPEAVGRSILQDVREFSAGHVQADDITLVCFGRLPN